MIHFNSITNAAIDTKDPLVIRKDSDGVTTLTLNRPKQFNALSVDMLSAMQTELDSITQDSNIRVVVIAANGKAFCAGHNLKEMRAHADKAFHQALFEQCSQMMLTINNITDCDCKSTGHRYSSRVSISRYV